MGYIRRSVYFDHIDIGMLIEKATDLGFYLVEHDRDGDHVTFEMEHEIGISLYNKCYGEIYIYSVKEDTIHIVTDLETNEIVSYLEKIIEQDE